VDWTYTNIYLLGILGRFLLAPLLPRTDLEEDARAQWRTFLKGAAHLGIGEYNSPTYLPVCIYALEQLRAFGPRDLRGQFEAMLEYFYFEFAARYHAPSGFPAGAMSRAYPWDRQPGQSLAAIVAHRQWGEPCRPRAPFLVNWLLTDYVAPRAIRRIALEKRFPLEIRSRAPLKQIERTDYFDRDFTLASQNGGWYGDQQVPLLITVRGDPQGEALHVEPSVPFAARLMSRQRGAAVEGTFSFEPAEVRYHARFRDSKSPAGFHDGLVFRWHLGSRQLVRAVRVNGRRWNGEAMAGRGNAALDLDLGRVRVTLRLVVPTPAGRPFGRRQIPTQVGATNAGSALRLHWQENQLHLDVILRASCADVIASSERPAMSFRLRIHPAAVRSRAVAPLAPLAPHVIHNSRLAHIVADDLLDFFLGRAAPPWENSKPRRSR
jgi:hypothetical protein